MKDSLLLIFLLFLASFSFAKDSSGFEVRLKSGTFVPEKTIDFNKAVMAQVSERNQENLYRLIQFYDIPSQADKELLRSIGINLISYVPNKAFVCGINKNISVSLLKDLNIRSIIPFDPDLKVSPELTQDKLPGWALLGEDIQLKVKYFSKSDRKNLIRMIEAGAGQVVDELIEINVLGIRCNINDFHLLSRNPLVQWIEPISQPHTPDDLKGTTSTRSNGLNTAYATGRKYDGTGVAVAVCDDGIIGPHIDHQGRLTQHTTDNSGNHGDMTAGILFGAGNLDPTIQGLAPGANMHIYRIGNISITGYPHILNGVANLNTLGTVITSTSYSQGTGGAYTTDTEFTDQQISQNPNMIHLFSAGNSGTFDHGYGAGAGWANISGGAKAGKNVICVGNVDDKDVLQVTSSRGPASDGRIKPDLCAQGFGQYAPDGNNTYQLGAGTSASSPTIAGVIAQLYQAYKEMHGGTEPETGLLKAALMNTAEDLGNPGPDFKHGWGRINGLKAVKIIEENRYIRDSILQGDTTSHTIAVPGNVSQLRIMTYWMDVEGNPNVSTALVNDINMQLVGPNSISYNPWVLDHTPAVANLDANAVRGIDSLNNAEQVTLDNPSAGNYTVKVTGTSIPQGPQTYYVLYDFIYDGVELTYPTGGEGFVPGETEVIRWDASANTTPFILEFSTDGGTTYTAISSNIPSTNRFYEWVVPTIVSSNTRMRVSRGAYSSVSDTNFTIVGIPQNLAVLSVCPDSIEIGWTGVGGATEYEVSMLGNKYMDSIGTTTTTSLKIGGLNPNIEHWFSVRSVVSGNPGRRAIAINQASGTINCVLNNDIKIETLSFPDDGIILSCRDLSNSIVKVQVNNLGLMPASNVQLNYQVNNGPVITETLAGPMPSGTNIEYQFATPADFSVAGVYSTRAWGAWAPDQNQYNDTTISTSNVINGSFISNLPYSEGLNSFPACATTTNCGLTTCNLMNGWINIDNTSSIDDIDWRTDAGGTTSSDTGPSSDYDLGTTSGNYLYLEASGSCDYQTAILLSPCIDLSSMDCGNFEFAYHMYGTNIGELHVDLQTQDSLIEDVINPVIGDQGNAWFLANVNLTPFAGDTVNLRIRGISASGFRGDIAIDAFSIQTSSQSVANFSYSSGADDTLIFANNSTGSITGYFWDFGDSTSSIDPNPVHHYTVPGSYNVTLIVTGDCGNDTMVQSIIVTSILQDLASQIEIHPNPSNGNFAISLPKQLARENVKIKILDILGQPILEINHESNQRVSPIAASYLPNGVYFVVISSENFNTTRKVVKHR